MILGRGPGVSGDLGSASGHTPLPGRFPAGTLAPLYDVLEPRGEPVGFQGRLCLGERHETAAHPVIEEAVELDLLIEAYATGRGGPDVRGHRRAAELHGGPGSSARNGRPRRP